MAILSNDKTYVTVVKGDTLSQIAVTYKKESGGKTYMELAKLNNIDNPNYIVVGQKIMLTGSAETPKKVVTGGPKVKVLGVQSNTERTLFATWSWDKENTKEYVVRWWYTTGDGVAFFGNEETVKYKQALWTPPDNAKRVDFYVKAIATTHKVNGKDEPWWKPTNWSKVTSFNMSDIPPKKPPAPKLTIDKYKATMSLSGLRELRASIIQFQLYRDESVNCTSDHGKVDVKETDTASREQPITPGSRYQVKCRSIRDGLYSDWSDWSEIVETVPATPAEITECIAKTETDVHIEWSPVKNATSYEVQYAEEKSTFNAADAEATTVEVKSDNGGTPPNNCNISKAETGKEYFFRVRAVNAIGASDWTEIKSTKLGKKPAAPTSWSSTTTAIVGETVNLYWLHNSEDGSKQDAYYLEIFADDALVITVDKTDLSDEEESGVLGGIAGALTGSSNDEEQRASRYQLDTTPYHEGVKIEWQVKTKGVKGNTDTKDDYSEFSIKRRIDVYARPTLGLSVTDKDGQIMETLTGFPFHVKGFTGPNTQSPIGYHVSVIANQGYETVDNVGNTVNVPTGGEIYSKYFDTKEQLSVEFSASNLNLENNVTYTIKCVASMNSGLTAEASVEFVVAWADEVYEPNLSIAIDEDTYSATIRPFCEDENGELIDGVLLSLYRREYDGSFVEIAADVDNMSYTYVVDPHPALDYARYRVVAKDKNTGAISYYDPPGHPVDGKAAIIQWAEQWTNYNMINEDPLVEQPWTGSLLKIPYNIDISDSNDADVALVNYIGRKHPVSYYGTQLGEKSNWTMEIPANDKETLYAIRRLAKWAGDVYVREPSGTGYWANIKVSYNKNHKALTIPVTFSITRVEGGI